MAIYRTISQGFWTDPKVDDDFTPEDKYFYLYLLTNPHTNICGCYEISMKQMERETGYNNDTIRRLLDRMERNHDVIMYDSDTKEVLIKNWHKYNWSTSENTMKSVLSVSGYIKSNHLRNFVNEKTEIYRKSETDNRVQNTVTDTDTDTDGYMGHTSPYQAPTKGIQKQRKFIPPTIEEVSDYIFEKGYSVNAERFWNYYESNGWMVGKNKMKSWQAAVAQWNAREDSGGKKGSIDWSKV